MLNPVTLLAAVMLCITLLPGAGRCDEIKEKMGSLSHSKEKVTVQADNVEYDRKTGMYTATGNVRISQGPAVLTSDRATLNERTGDAEAAGKARLVSEDNVVFADSIKVNFNTSLGVIEQGNIFVEKENYHITGSSMQRVSEDEYLIYSGNMTTCDASNPFWKISASSLNVKMDKDVTARNIVMRIKGIPVLYSPYAWFPLLKPRTSGFLIPGAGYSTNNGARLFISYYWAPFDNIDTTLSLDYRSMRGVGISDEFRFALDKDTQGRFYGYYMDDRKENKVRYNVLFRFQEVFTPSLSGRIDLNLSDRQFYRDLTDSTMERTQRSIDSNVFLTNRWDWGRAYLFSQYTRSLDTFNNDFIVQRLPEAGFNIFKKQVAGLPIYLDLDSSASYFHKVEGVSGGRLDIFPKLSGYFNLAGINFSPKVGYRETAYDLHGDRDGQLDKERGLFGAGLKVQTDFYRLYTFNGGLFEALRHTLEPAAAYNWVGDRGGSEFPKFDAVDTYGRKSQLAYSLTNRFVLKYRTAENSPARVDYMTLKLSQFYDFHAENLVSGSKRAFSSLYGEIIYKAGQQITLNNDFRYDVYGGSFISVNTDLRYEGGSGMWHVTIGQRFSADAEQIFMSPSRFDFFTPSADFISDFIVQKLAREDERVNFLTFEAGVVINQFWSAKGKIWYDIHTGNFRETDFSATYSSQCWGITANYVNRPGERQVIVFLNLKGLGILRI
jgi:LPS-assembly protein